MSNIKYVLSRVTKMDYKAMFSKINGIHKKTGKSRIYILNDMRKCAVKYGAGYMDYDLFEMYNLTDEQRDTYLTRGRNNALIVKYNQKEYIHLFDNKADFNELFNKYLKRDWVKVTIDNKDDVLKFIKNHDEFMVKPTAGTCGHGIEKLHVSDYESIDELYDYLMSGDDDIILEEVIKQHKLLNKIYPNSINTLRVVTILDENNIAHVICAYFRIGNSDLPVDNFNSGGMNVPVDVATGTVKYPAIDKAKNVYDHHPLTGTKIVGFKFPDWQKAMDLVKELALIVPEVRYVGWDICFTPDGPCVVEGNHFPGHDLYQLPIHTPDKIGMMPKLNFK